MFRTSRWSGLLVVFALVLPAASAADKDKPVTSKKDAAAKMIAAGELTGRVVNVDAEKKLLTLELTVVYSVPNVGAINNIANIQAQMATARDIGTMRNLQVELLKNQAQMYDVRKESHNVDIETADEVTVRRKDPPVIPDEKGFVKKLTAKELKELKGDPRLPGYKADFDDVKQDQVVHVKLAKPKPAPRGKPVDKDAPPVKPVATQIMILAEPPAK